MSKIFKAASIASLALTTVAALSVTDVSFALEATNEEENIPEAPIVIDPEMIENEGESAVIFGEMQEVTAEIPEEVVEADRIANEQQEALGEFNDAEAGSLRALVDQQSIGGELSEEMQCLAGTVYFESKGESLAGQLAVARVVMARAESSRFPNSICGVVYQRKQFSFIRNGRMPRINKSHFHWRNAVAISKIAMNDAWKSPVEGALFFHARYVSPGWRLKRMATIDNHIFYQ